MNWDAIQWATGIFIALAGAGWTIIQMREKSEERIQEMKDEKTQNIIDDIQNLVNKLENFQTLQNAQGQKLAVMSNEMTNKFMLLEERIKSNSSGAERVTEALTNFVKSTDTRFKNIEHAMGNMQLVKIGKDTFMVKNLRREERG